MAERELTLHLGARGQKLEARSSPLEARRWKLAARSCYIVADRAITC